MLLFLLRFVLVGFTLHPTKLELTQCCFHFPSNLNFPLLGIVFDAYILTLLISLLLGVSNQSNTVSCMADSKNTFKHIPPFLSTSLQIISDQRKMLKSRDSQNPDLFLFSCMDIISILLYFRMGSVFIIHLVHEKKMFSCPENGKTAFENRKTRKRKCNYLLDIINN